MTSKGLYIICRVANFPRYGKHRKITEIEYKTENTENRGKQRFCNSKTNKQKKWKLLFLEHFIIVKFIFKNLRGYCTSGPYFWRFCVFSQKIKQPRKKYPMDLVRNVPRNSKITILLQCRPLLWSYSEKCAKINIFHVLSHKSITTWVSETPVQ